jgi:hypothetical protein
VNKAEAEFWRRSEGWDIGWSDTKLQARPADAPN